MKMNKTDRKQKEWPKRFWDKVNKTESCWLWTGYICRLGYGQITRPGFARASGAHRIALELNGAELTSSDIVMHSCDVRECVNPDHLSIGTHQKNQADKVTKWRHAFGEDQGLAVLTVEQVLKMRDEHKSGASIPDVAKKFNCKYHTAYAVIRRASWAWL